MSTLRRGRWTNWAGNQSGRPASVSIPSSESELSSVVERARRAGTTVKAVGSGHSFTGAALTDGVLVSLDRLTSILDVDRAALEVTVEAGITIDELNRRLHELGLAMPNLGDIAYQTISGAIATSTHGTGRRFTGLAAQVRRVRLVVGDGSIVDLSPSDGPLFRSALVNVGALGIVVAYTLAVVPVFRLRAVEGAQPLDALLEALDDHVDANDHFEFFWIPHTKWALTKRNERTDDPADRQSAKSRISHWYSKTFMENYAFGAVCRVGNRFPHLVPRLATALPSSGQTTRVEDSFRVFASQRIVKFVEMEYAVPRAACAEVLRRVRHMIDDEGHLVGFPVEVRFTAADDVTLSTAHGRESAYVAVHMHKGVPWPRTERYMRSVARIMADHDGRPHWGKMHFLGASELSRLYPAWSDFMEAREKFDPWRTFANAYTRQVFGD